MAWLSTLTEQFGRSDREHPEEGMGKEWEPVSVCNSSCSLSKGREATAGGKWGVQGGLCKMCDVGTPFTSRGVGFRFRVCVLEKAAHK